MVSLETKGPCVELRFESSRTIEDRSEPARALIDPPRGPEVLEHQHHLEREADLVLGRPIDGGANVVALGEHELVSLRVGADAGLRREVRRFCDREHSLSA